MLRMRVLVYKRTHTGDPDAEGQFGICDCMGQVRTWVFNAVIGVGGISAKPKSLARKVNWIGMGRHDGQWYKRGPIITFEHFLLFESDGPSFPELAPQLAARMYSNDRCNLIVDDGSEQEYGQQSRFSKWPRMLRHRQVEFQRTTEHVSVAPACRKAEQKLL